MRLTTHQIDGILKALVGVLAHTQAELYLYGSRVDDKKRGGDIDLLLVVHHASVKTKLLSEKHLLISQMKTYIGDQRIDLKIALDTELKTDPFLQLATEGSQKIKLFSSPAMIINKVKPVIME